MPADNRNQMRYNLSRCYPFDPVSPLPDMPDVQSWNYNALNQIPRSKLTGYLTLAAFAKCSCKHGPKSIALTWLIARGNKLNKVLRTPSRKAPDNTPAKSSRPASLSHFSLQVPPYTPPEDTLSRLRSLPPGGTPAAQLRNQ